MDQDDRLGDSPMDPRRRSSSISRRFPGRISTTTVDQRSKGIHSFPRKDNSISCPRIDLLSNTNREYPCRIYLSTLNVQVRIDLFSTTSFHSNSSLLVKFVGHWFVHRNFVLHFFFMSMASLNKHNPYRDNRKDFASLVFH
jgi:hypothetical protein